jgi:drug/metabolite transporter (DMT)-like permease
VGGSAFAVTLFYTLVDYVEIVFASLITYIIPVFAVFWGLLDGESLTILQVLFMLVVFFGVFLVNRNGKKNRNNSD